MRGLAVQPIAGEPFRADTGVGASRYVELLTKAFDIKDAPEGHDGCQPAGGRVCSGA